MLQKLRLAVFFEHELSAGGNYQQPLNSVNIAKSISADLADVVFITTLVSNKELLKTYGIDAVLYAPSIISHFWLKLRCKVPFILFSILKKIDRENYLERFLNTHKIDLVYFTSQSGLAEYLEKTNYIYTLFDLCHRDHPEFPEVSAYRTFYNRDIHFRKVLAKATAVFVESELGKKNAIKRYALDDARVYVFPSSPALGIGSKMDGSTETIVDIKNEYDIKTDYIFYPAQFWAHKNHVYILQGLKCLESIFGIKLSVIFAGGDQGNMKYVKSIVSELNLVDRVIFAGFVPNDKIIHLYQQALALVMPSYFGPTNLPPLEAFGLGVPVLYSDLPGLRDQVGNAALLLDLSEPSCLAKQLELLITDSELSKKLILNGYSRLQDINDTKVRLGILNTVLQKFYRYRICWE
jgi:glycosyltransferase involved in cell wall biosynthesis